MHACRQGEWPSFPRDISPKKPLLSGRLDYNRCLALAERAAAGPVTKELTLVPLWACAAEDDVSDEWVAVHGVVEEGRPFSVQETGPFIGIEDATPSADALWDCTVRRWTAATVVETRSYGPSVPLQLRTGAFGVLEIDVEEVVSVNVREAEPRPRPTREVPMWSSWLEPRVRVSPELKSQIRTLCFTSDYEEE